ncbi:MAG TPA: nucleotidyltransferase domain-containing protein [Dongiaceae bacterium]|nr:nucleotidyltransferase domain-containing protein [Dongiaceae bacterium]
MLAHDEKLTEVVRRLQEAAGDNLFSVVLYGSAARGEYQPQRSDLNLLCLLKSAKAHELARLSGVIRWWSGQLQEPVPHFFTPEELKSSADVFAIELLDIGRSHRVLFGPDPIADLEVPTNLHRVQVEHELRSVQQKLREQLVRGGEDESHLRNTYSRSISGVAVLLRHVLIAFGEDPPADRASVFLRVAELTGADASAFETGTALRDGHSIPEISRAYGKYLDALATVVHALDSLVPKREWQRVRKQNF